MDEIISSKYVNIFRVQGGIVPNASRFRFKIVNGRTKIIGKERLYVTFKDENRVIEYWIKRGDKAEVFMAKVNKQFYEKVMNNAVKQSRGKEFPHLPQFGDASKTKHSVGIPKEYFDELLNSMKEPEILKFK